jgi:hypothetical protein
VAASLRLWLILLDPNFTKSGVRQEGPPLVGFEIGKASAVGGRFFSISGFDRCEEGAVSYEQVVKL